MTQTFEEWWKMAEGKYSYGADIKQIAQAAWNARPSLPEIEGDELIELMQEVFCEIKHERHRDTMKAAITRLKDNPWTPIGEAKCTAIMKHMISGRDSQSSRADCVCCDGPHVFQRFFVVEDMEPPVYSQSKFAGVQDFIQTGIARDVAEGQRVEITVRLLPILPPVGE